MEGNKGYRQGPGPHLDGERHTKTEQEVSLQLAKLVEEIDRELDHATHQRKQAALDLDYAIKVEEVLIERKRDATRLINSLAYVPELRTVKQLNAEIAQADAADDLRTTTAKEGR